MNLNVWKYKILRRLARLTVETAALVTYKRMPPFVSAAAIVQRGDKFLAIRDTAQRMLVLPGGHLHWGESPEDGIRREVFEETGYSVTPRQLFRTFASASGLSDRGIIRVIMEADVVGGSPRSSPEGDVEWVTAEQLQSEGARDAGIVRLWLEARSNAEASDSAVAEVEG